MIIMIIMIAPERDDVRSVDGACVLKAPFESLHSAKGGVVETGCSGLHWIIDCFTT